MKTKKRLVVVDLASGVEKVAVEAPVSESVTISEDGRWGILGPNQVTRDWIIWDFHLGTKTKLTLEVGKDHYFHFASSGNLLIETIDGMPNVRIIDTRTGITTRTIETQGPVSVCSAFTADVMAVTARPSPGGISDTIFVAPSTGQEKGKAVGHSAYPKGAISFSDKGRWFATVVNEDAARLQYTTCPDGTLLVTDLENE